MQTLLSIFRTTNHVLSLSLADLTEETARERSRGSEGPSITWTVGHLLCNRHRVLAYLGHEQPKNPWLEAFDETPATDGADYPTIDEMRLEWEKTHQVLEQAFAGLTPDALDRPVGKPGLHGETKVHDKVSFLAWHEGYHVGAVGAIRIAAGLDGPAVLAKAAAAKS